jgi:hypothetical protein
MRGGQCSIRGPAPGARPQGPSSDRSGPPSGRIVRSGLLGGLDEPLARIGAGLLEGLGERPLRGREDLDERVPVASQAPELGRVAKVEPGPQRVIVVPPDPLDLRLQLLPGAHGTSILTALGSAGGAGLLMLVLMPLLVDRDRAKLGGEGRGFGESEL